jgi:hypothetical protein
MHEIVKKRVDLLDCLFFADVMSSLDMHGCVA